jgi:hypothetical protein
MWTNKKFLIWGTTYPDFSKSHYETVCTGALDADTGRFVRIYPIALRHRKEPFGHYDWIEAPAMKNGGDFRAESFKIDQTNIKVVGNIGTKDGWVERSSWILRPSNVFSSVEALQAAEAIDHTSLGMVKPKNVRKIYARRKSDAERIEWDQARADALAQKDMFVDAETMTKELVFMPIQYRAVFTCDDSMCDTEHDFGILDWGTYVLHRRMFAQKGPAFAERDVISHLENILDPATHDAHFFLGNSKAHCRNFFVVGLFYPPKAKPIQPKPQMSLF